LVAITGDFTSVVRELPRPLPDVSVCCLTEPFVEFADRSWREGRLEQGIRAAETALQSICEVCSEPCTLYAGLLLVLLLSRIRRVDQARSVLQAMSGQLEALGNGPLLASARLVGAKVSVAAGDYDNAASLAITGLREANEARVRGWTPLGNFVLGLTALRRGDITTAMRYAQRIEEDAIFNREMFPAGQAAWLIVQITEAEKGRDTAAALAAELLARGPTTRQLLIAEPAALPWLVRLMLRCDERTPAQEGVRVAHELAADNPSVQSLEASAMHTAGLFEEDLDKLVRASGEHVDPWARASALEDVGLVLQRREPGDPRIAESFEQAMTSYTEIGSLRDSSRLKSRLRKINTSLHPRNPGRAPSEVPTLTDTEYAVAKLVAEGFTNGQAADQLFLSRHTVAFHLRKIFRKLGVGSRVQLAGIWNKLELVDYSVANGRSGREPDRASSTPSLGTRTGPASWSVRRGESGICA
jgi:DNA-binding CsgD family transcriptional regulator